MGESDHCYIFLDAVATVHVLKAGNHDVKKLSKLELYILQD